MPRDRNAGLMGRVAALLVLALTACSPPAGAPDVDLIVTNGSVLDGLGAPAVAADVVIDDGLIVALGPDLADSYSAARVVDAAGRIVAPGFIDPHSHGNPFETPAFENFLAMGVTTITLGQDGSSPAVEDLAAWLDRVAARGISLNLALFVGHGTLREQAGIGLSPEPTPAQLADMIARLDKALDVTWGLSTGLEYNPGLNAPPQELAALARAVGSRDRIIMSHLRSEDDDQLAAALDELVAQGEHARVHVAHLKSVYGKGAERGREILAMLEKARARGAAITADVYPYSASYTGLSLLFPRWAKTVEQFAEAKATRYQELADYLRARVMARNGPEATLLGVEPFVGETLADLAARFELPFERVLIDVLGPDAGNAAYFVMDEVLQAELLADPHVAVGSDGSPTGFHPRGHGTFAKVIEQYVVAEERLSLAEAVRKMTSLPADIIGLEDRGRLLPGHAADIVVFAPEAVRARASYVDPLKLAQGFEFVIVNGRVAREHGVLSNDAHGQVLRP